MEHAERIAHPMTLQTSDRYQTTSHYFVLRCDGPDCTAKIEADSLTVARRLASEAGWTRTRGYLREDRCSEHRIPE